MERVAIFRGRDDTAAGFNPLCQQVDQWYRENHDVKIVDRKISVAVDGLVIAIFYQEPSIVVSPDSELSIKDCYPN